MLRERNKLIVRLHRTLDILLTVLSFLGAYSLKKYIFWGKWGGLSTGPNYSAVLLMIVILWYVVFAWQKVYESYRQRSATHILKNVLSSVSMAMALLLCSLYLLEMKDVSRGMLSIFYFFNIFLLCASKITVYRVLNRYRAKGYNYRNVVIVGNRERAKDVIAAIQSNTTSGYRVVGCLNVSEHRECGKLPGGVQTIGNIKDLDQLLPEMIVDELIFAAPLTIIDGVDGHIALAEEMGITVRIIPDWQLYYLKYKPGIAKLNYENFLNIPTLSLCSVSPYRADLLIKSTIDYVLALVLMVVCAPFFVLISLSIKIVSKGPVFFTQERIGLNGRRFMVYKFRTMVNGAEKIREELEGLNESDGPVFKIERDPRIIPWLGTFLRKSSLDELPQLINVLRGEMSLVGPRPPLPGEVKKYAVWQRRRLSMKPGLTCLWQIFPRRNEVSFDGWMKLDMQYIDNWSLWLDWKIIAKTVQTVLIGGGR